MDRNSLLSALRTAPMAERVITALDVPSTETAAELARSLGATCRLVKVGLELYAAAGPPIVEQLRRLGKEVFLDLKLHDIPNTVAGAARVAAGLQAAMLTVHASGGRRMLQAAVAAVANTVGDPQGRRCALLGVTVLTSLSAEELQETAPSQEDLPHRILRLARIAWQCGCDGIVCSPTDLPLLRAELGPEPLIVTPGIRPPASAADDQRRTATPAAAVAAGADYLVIGRPITRAADPGRALQDIGRQLA